MKLPFRKPQQDEIDDVTFPELVFAHFLRQREAYVAVQEGAPAERALHGPAQQEYDRCLKSFTRRHGEIVDAYWCTHEISGIALTERRRWGWRGIWPHHEIVTRLHQATGWATKSSQPIAAEMHACESLAIRANEVLLGTSERIVMQLLLALAARLLAVVDADGPPEPGAVRRAVEESHKQLREIHTYYDRAGQKAVRVFYVGGMIFGLSLIGLGVLAAWALGWSEHMVVALGMGAIGAVISVLTRMANRDSRFNLDHEVGQKEARRLGAFRPFIGATFGALLYLAVSGRLLVVGAVENKTLAFYAVISFLAGFSERWAKVVLDIAPPEPQAKPVPTATQQSRPQEDDDPEAALAAPESNGAGAAAARRGATAARS